MIDIFGVTFAVLAAIVTAAIAAFVLDFAINSFKDENDE